MLSLKLERGTLTGPKTPLEWSDENNEKKKIKNIQHLFSSRPNENGVTSDVNCEVKSFSL